MYYNATTGEEARRRFTAFIDILSPSETIQWTLILHFTLHTTTMHGNHYTPHTTHATMVEEHSILCSEGGCLKSYASVPHKRFLGGKKVLRPMNNPLVYCRYSTKNI